MAANSGARIGVANSLKNKFKVCWTDEADPNKGFKYIYLTKEDYDGIVQDHHDTNADGKNVPMPVICTATTTASGEIRYMITDIIGIVSSVAVAGYR